MSTRSRSGADVFLAMERGEVDGVCEALDSVESRRPDWIAQKKVSVVLQGGAEPNPDLPGVPYVLDLARTPDERRAIAFLYAGEGVGRPYVAPPDLPPGRLALLRAAFDATMRDPDFIKDAAAQKFEPKPKTGAYLDATGAGRLRHARRGGGAGRADDAVEHFPEMWPPAFRGKCDQIWNLERFPMQSNRKAHWFT